MQLNNQTTRSILWIWITIVIFGILLAGIWLPLPAQAGSYKLPPRPNPPTPIPTPAAPRNFDRGDGPEKPLGAYIELHASSVPVGAWTLVQWQDSTGNWQGVAGWQGSLEAQQTKTWWVAAKDFGTGPFRWVVLGQPGGAILAASQPFMLPKGADALVQVNITAN